MSAVGDALRGIRTILLLQEDVRRLEQRVDGQRDEMRDFAATMIGLDRRLIRIETMVEMAGRSGGPPRIEG